MDNNEKKNVCIKDGKELLKEQENGKGIVKKTNVKECELCRNETKCKKGHSRGGKRGKN